MRRCLLPMRPSFGAAWLVFCMVGALELRAQSSTLFVRGYVRDSLSGETLPGAVVRIAAGGPGVAANEFGYFCLPLDPALLPLEVEASYLGYGSWRRSAGIDSTLWEVLLRPGVDLAVAEVKASRASWGQAGGHRLQMARLRELPTLMGEADPLKALQLLPGIKYSYEGVSALSVRGGSTDQNLFLLDGIPLYQVNHALGLFSAFNAVAIKDFTLLPGGIPARYGGRLSSALIANTRSGNQERRQGEISMGLISAGLALEGPMGKGRGNTFLVAARRSYPDLLIRPILMQDELRTDFAANFYDLNGKFTFALGKKGQLSFGVYHSRDRFLDARREPPPPGAPRLGVINTFESRWRNLLVNTRFSYAATSRWFITATLAYSGYQVTYSDATDYNDGSARLGGSFSSGIADRVFHLHNEYDVNTRRRWYWGGNVTRHLFSPGRAVEIVGNQERAAPSQADMPGLAAYLYFEDEYTANRWRIHTGFNASLYHDPESGRVVAHPQPRLAASFQATQRLMGRASFMRTAQYVAQVSSEAPGFPRDLFVPTARGLLPQLGWQAGLGADWVWGKGAYRLALDGYYKELNNLVALREGANATDARDSWRGKLTQGNGQAYGMEAMVSKTQGRTTGWMAYALAWSWRQFADINGGAVFPYRFDRRHELALALQHRLSERATLSANWIFNSSNPVTLPVGVYQTATWGPNGQIAGFEDHIAYGPRNGSRLRPTHRLDVSLTLSRKRASHTRQLQLGLYNAYSRANPLFVSSSLEFVAQQGQLGRRLSIWQNSYLPLLPVVSYHLQF